MRVHNEYVITNVHLICKWYIYIEQYSKQQDNVANNGAITLNNEHDENIERLSGNDVQNNHFISEGKMPSWKEMRQLQDNVYAWCYLNFYFLPCVVGKCMWVSSIQRGCKTKIFGHTIQWGILSTSFEKLLGFVVVGV